MEKVISNTAYAGDLRIPIKMWVTDLEESALKQAVNLANLPFAFKHVALMPDAHAGYGMPIGGVLATKGVVIPNAVGVDIGCGMKVLKTNLHVDEMTADKRKTVMEMIREVIPLGMKHHDKPQHLNAGLFFNPDIGDFIGSQLESIVFQVGTLGGGNHFIEIQVGDDGLVYVMLHSGSRNLGKQVGDHYNKIAMQLNEKWYSSVTADKQLAFLPLYDMTGAAYMRDMIYCIEFAKASRTMMMDRIQNILIKVFPKVEFPNIGKLNHSTLDVPHNYASLENHFGENVLVHRKGATKAAAGGYGIIPGSQGTSSYIVIGKGNKESFESCSHGAGRVMGRNEARKTLDLQKEIARLDEMGIIHSIRNTDDLDEAAGAYKNIDTVMENQKDLVDIAVKLTPLAVIKAQEKPKVKKNKEKQNEHIQE